MENPFCHEYWSEFEVQSEDWWKVFSTHQLFKKKNKIRNGNENEFRNEIKNEKWNKNGIEKGNGNENKFRNGNGNENENGFGNGKNNTNKNIKHIKIII